MEIYVFLAFILLLSVYLGFELINKVPATLHTPLMSASNAISGITLLGALIIAGRTSSPELRTMIGSAAVLLATINVIGGYAVTDRMLAMFKKKEETKK
ncbi:NAD(P) transhydrogenase subunit alpha [Zhongshania borealis]|jgi:NAD(P) transhydrogenase subunit alpha|uniref:proton-translocating NAD(P)(+) transhydrogenase n=1 Tax=Zhongshania borealis TaxID=889488 RepID=A0ABP7WSB6_9GAMM|tara:strand:- start:841 stop:1137 length:297 start_codon:yes stop_codon:yes gene_type:complete